MLTAAKEIIGNVFESCPDIRMTFLGIIIVKMLLDINHIFFPEFRLLQTRT